jgi:hypothetical protein
MNHKVNEVLLDWLFRNGREPVKRIDIWDLDDYTKILPHVTWCIKQGYINETRSLLDGRFSHAITDKGLEFLNKGENDGTNK